MDLKIINIGFYLVWLLAVNGIAQTKGLTEYNQLLQQFEQRSPIAFRCIYQIYKGFDLVELEQVVDMEVKKEGGKIYAKFEDFEILHEGDYYLQIDHQEKVIYVQKNEKEVGKSLTQLNLADWISTFSMEGKQRQTPEGRTILTFSTTESKMFIELEYDPQKQLIYKSMSKVDVADYLGMSYPYDQKTITTAFSNFQLDNIKIPLQLSEILRRQGKRWHTQNQFQTYQIIDGDQQG